MKNPSSFDIGTQRFNFVSTCRKSVSQSMAVPVLNGWLRLLSAYRLIQCNLMQKVEKMRSQSGSFFVFVFQIDNLSAKRCLWLEYDWL